MPRIGNRTIGEFSRGWRRRGSAPLIASCGALVFVLVIAACSGVNDNGTTLDTLATMEARQNQSPPPAATLDPSSGPPAPAQLAALGQQLYGSMGCLACHSVEGSPSVGPTWQGLWMSDVPLADGSTVVADEQYISTAILDPDAQIHDGFPNMMPPFEGRLDENQISALIEYIKTLE